MGRRMGPRKMTIADAKEILRPYGVVITKPDPHYTEYRVNFLKGREETAYYTDDLVDAVRTGQLMVKHQSH